MNLPVKPPLPPMLARLARELPPGLLYEPKWDGFRCIAFCDDGEIDLRSRNDRPLARYFPELVAAFARLPERRIVLDGELVVPTAESFDFTSLLSRLHPTQSRVERLTRETPAWFIAFDVLGRGDDDLRGLPFAERRAHLEQLLRTAGVPLTLRRSLATPSSPRTGFISGAASTASLPRIPEPPTDPASAHWSR